MLLNVTHTTTYTFEQPVRYGLQQLRLTPKSRIGQNVVNWSMNISGGQLEAEFDDHHANVVSLISFDAGTNEITITCEGEIATEDQAGVVGKQKGCIPLWLFQRSTELTRATSNVRKLTKNLRDDFDDEIALLHALSTRILEAVPYETGTTHSATSADAAMTNGYGVCQDHAHIFLAATRAMGFPARYVSGYLRMDDRTQQDATHAWAEAHVEGIGWVGFDVSNSISPDDRYVRVATGLDYREAAPISGVRFGAGEETLKVDVTVQEQ